MAALSKDAYEAIVIGSGFGGAVATCRLAQAGVDVALLERGRRYAHGTFPRHPVRYDLMDWHQGGLYDVRALQDVMIVQGAGLGGGSLIYANVQMRPQGETFAEGWPTYSIKCLNNLRRPCETVHFVASKSDACPGFSSIAKYLQQMAQA